MAWDSTSSSIILSTHLLLWLRLGMLEVFQGNPSYLLPAPRSRFNGSQSSTRMCLCGQGCAFPAKTCLSGQGCAFPAKGVPFPAKYVSSGQ